MFATKKGYQSGAKTKAVRNNVDLLIVREQNESDWYAPDGTPLLKKIHVDFMYEMPATIHSFFPALDADWIEKNTDIDTSKRLCLESGGNWFWRLSERVEFCGGQAARSRVSSAI